MNKFLDVLNPGGKDPTQDFSTGPDPPDAKGHPPVNFHAYAACAHGRFARRVSDLQAGVVLLLLRGDLSDSLYASKKLASKRIPFLISWKESGRHQVAQALSRPGVLARFMEVSRIASGFLASAPWLLPMYRAASLTFGEFVPTPYPIDFPEWDFRISAEERSGIFLGTREFFVLSRNHAAAVFSACDLASRFGIKVTCMNTEGRRGRTLLCDIDAGRGVLQIVEGRLPYRDYLRLIARHQVVLQFDRSGVPGQVAGDAALCGVPAVGGDGALDSILNGTNLAAGGGGDFRETVERASRLLTDFSLYLDAVETLRQKALATISFRRGSEMLRQLIERLS